MCFGLFFITTHKGSLHEIMAKRKAPIPKIDKTKAPQKKSYNINSESNFIIVGMGTSASGLETFNQFF
jgi:two-component system CheB/CheR fusion protein